MTLNDETSGLSLGQWTSPSIPAGSEPQFPISTVETGTGQTFTKPNYYAISVKTGITGYFQHVLWRAADGTLTNLSTCPAGMTASGAKLSGVHSSLFGDTYPSTIAVTNTGAASAPVTLGVYDARDGSKRGTYTTAAIPANGQVMVSMAAIEASVGAPTAGMFHYVILAEDPFTGFLQHLLTNAKAGVITDMTTGCALGLQASAKAQTFVSGSRFGGSGQSGQAGADGYLLICSSAGRFRYALPEDMPATPVGGYLTRPAWYPPLASIFMSNNAPSCPASGRINLTSMIVPVDQLSTSTPQGAMIGGHVTPIDHAYVGLKVLDKP